MTAHPDGHGGDENVVEVKVAQLCGQQGPSKLYTFKWLIVCYMTLSSIFKKWQPRTGRQTVGGAPVQSTSRSLASSPVSPLSWCRSRRRQGVTLKSECLLSLPKFTLQVS